MRLKPLPAAARRRPVRRFRRPRRGGRKAEHALGPAIDRRHHLQREPGTGEGHPAHHAGHGAEPDRPARGERTHAPGDGAAAQPHPPRCARHARAELRLRPAHARQAPREVRGAQRAHRAHAPHYRRRIDRAGDRARRQRRRGAEDRRPHRNRAPGPHRLRQRARPTCATSLRWSPSFPAAAPARRRSSFPTCPGGSPGRPTTSPS